MSTELPEKSPFYTVSTAMEGARVLEILIGDVQPIERANLQRIFQEQLDSTNAPLEESWWQAIAESSARLGMRPSVFDCSIQQAASLVDNGAEIVIYGGKQSLNWSLLRRRGSKGFELFESIRNQFQFLKNRRQLLAALTDLSRDQHLRVVAFNGRDFIAAAHANTHHAHTPLHRLWGIVRPEASDIWLVFVFAIVVGIFALASPIAVESLVNTVAFGQFLQPIIVLSTILFGFLGLSAAIRVLQTYVVEVVQQRLFARVAADLAHRLPRVALESCEGKNLQELVNRFFDIVTVQKVTANLLLDGVGLAVGALVGMVVLGFYHPWLLGLDILLLAALAFIIFVLGRGGLGTAMKESKSKYYMAAWLEDIARCPIAFRSAAGKNLAASHADHLIYDYIIARRKHFKVLLRQNAFALVLQAFASTLLLGVGGYLVVAGELTLGQLVAAELIVTVVVGAFAKMGKHIEGFYDLLAGVDKLGILFDLPLERQGGIFSSASREASSLSFQGLSYVREGHPVFAAPLSLEVSPRESIAFLGEAGTGKSVLLDLIYGSRQPTSGGVFLDGRQVCSLQTDDYRAHVSLVRDGEIFAGSVIENLHLQRPDISNADIENALRNVGLLNTVMNFEHALEEHLTSDGGPFSTNQARLFLLARAIAASPTLLLIDGILDGIADKNLWPILDWLTDGERPWTLVIATGRRDIAERCSTRVALEPGGAVINPPRRNDSSTFH